MTNPAPFIGIMRHRIGIDGDGVTTLAAFHGCPLHCHYCLLHKSVLIYNKILYFRTSHSSI